MTAEGEQGEGDERLRAVEAERDAGEEPEAGGVHPRTDPQTTHGSSRRARYACRRATSSPASVLTNQQQKAQSGQDTA